jgi:zinc/manganese transport system substrate-binding protein
VRAADLIVMTGLGLAAGLEGAIGAARDAGVPVLELGPRLNPVPFSRREGNAGADPTGPGDAGVLDPHVWMDPDRMTRAATLIAAEVAGLGVDRATLDRRATEYAATLARADEQIQAALAPLPDDRRILVTNHESMGYFADRYGFTVLGVIVPGGSTLAEPSAADLARLADAVRTADVPVIFAETTAPTKLADALARETGRDVRVVELYTEALGEPGSGADTYPGMLVTDARRIAEGFGVATGGTGTASTGGG